MKCNLCHGQGWVDTFIGESNGYRPIIKQCPHQCNISGYSQEVSKRLNAAPHNKPAETPRKHQPKLKVIHGGR